MKKIINKIKSTGVASPEQMNSLNQSMSNLKGLLQKAATLYVSCKDDLNKKEVNKVFLFASYAEKMLKSVEYIYMLESDKPEYMNNRRILSQWAREDALAAKSKDVAGTNIPVIDNECEDR